MNAPSPTERIEPSLADFWEPMTADKAISLVHTKHGLSLSKDDPVLAVVTLMNAFGEDLKKMMSAERAGFAAAVREETKELTVALDAKTSGVMESFETLASSMGRENIETTVAAVVEHTRQTERLHRSNRRLALAMGVCTTLIWLAVAAFYVLLK